MGLVIIQLVFGNVAYSTYIIFCNYDDKGKMKDRKLYLPHDCH